MLDKYRYLLWIIFWVLFFIICVINQKKVYYPVIVYNHPDKHESRLKFKSAPDSISQRFPEWNQNPIYDKIMTKRR